MSQSKAQSSKKQGANSASFIDTQYAFAAHIRAPGKNPAPEGIEDRRLAIYRDLFFNNVQSFMSNTFPVLKEVLGEDGWLSLMRDYFAKHQSKTPLFHEMPRELLRYLEHEREAEPSDPPFMLELAHYEWVELALSTAEDELPAPTTIPEDTLLDACFSLSPLAWLLTYQFDVHRISADYQPTEPPLEPTYIVVFRNSHDEIGFESLNAVTARLLSLIQDAPHTAAIEHLQQISGELNHPNPQTVIEAGQSLLKDLLHKDIIFSS